MIGRLIKKKLNANKLANVFVNSILEATENGFDDVRAMINEDNAFISDPNISNSAMDKFLLVVTVGNLRYLDSYFEVTEAKEIRKQIVKKFADIYSLEDYKMDKLFAEYDQFISRVNHPSKNTLYGLSKAVFHKFKLNDHQESYFKNLQTPNPLFLKRMDEVMMNFLWDWDEFFKKHKMNFG